MSRFLILTPCLSDNDAVSNDVYGMCRALQECGHTALLFSPSWPEQRRDVHPVKDLATHTQDPANTLIYHYSVGWDCGLEILRQARCKRVVKYHNVTPHEFFASVSKDFEVVCRHGRAQLRDVAALPLDAFLADSQFNLDELIALGADPKRSSVVPPFHVTADLETGHADLDVLDRYQDGKTNLLMVGRLAPNKGHAALIDAFAVYQHVYESASRLLIVGKADPRLDAYTSRLRQQIDSLGLKDSVVFTGEVTSAALKAYYLLADLFVITSEHEGFCVPLVEAMALRVPILASGVTAVPGTLGDAGLAWEEADPVILAESIDTLVEDETLRAALSLRGVERYREQFTHTSIVKQFREALGLSDTPASEGLRSAA